MRSILNDSFWIILSFTDSFILFFSFLIVSLILSGMLLLLHFNSGLWYSAAAPWKVLTVESVDSLLVQSFIVFFSFVFSRWAWKRKMEKKKNSHSDLYVKNIWVLEYFNFNWHNEWGRQPAFNFFPVTIPSNSCQIRLDKHARQIKVMRIVWKLINTMLHAEKKNYKF